MIYEPKSAAKAVKQRARKAVQYNEGADEDTRVVQRPAANRVTAQPAAAASKVTGGKGYKTGMVLARAKLPRGTSEIAATRDRQKTLLSKGQYRDAEKVAREASAGTLKTGTMPKKRDAKGADSEHEKAFYSWMKTALGGKVRVSEAE